MSVYEILEDDGNYYIATELLEGGELFDRIIEVKMRNNFLLVLGLFSFCMVSKVHQSEIQCFPWPDVLSEL